MANKLQYESSPYLKQHQHNPVDWYPWGGEALQRAKDENKLIIVSIGYSACHWCHVMERESFESDDVAAVMNKYFVSIKVDREERPDIDQIYMIAVQLMTNSGGWPLNCICLPDGRPIYGGTYFKPFDWKNVLLQLVDMWHNTPEVAFDYAHRLTTGIEQSEKLAISRIPDNYSTEDITDIVRPWKRSFDKTDGGFNRAPKFPLPNNWVFLLRYAVLQQDTETLEHVHFTLGKIASGGIYDQVGGGFARYSVDGQWHIPHFEKMLYDNGQLVSLYAEAWQNRPDPLYKRVIIETLAWVSREMTSPDGGFYSALDADSDGIEGKYYTFGQNEIEKILGEDAALFIRYFNVTPSGNWGEEMTNVFHCDDDADKLAEEAGFTATEWDEYLKETKYKLFSYREKRVRPALDDKQLTAWNGLMLKGFIDAYEIFGDEEYLNVALRNAAFIRQHLYTNSGGLLRQPNTSDNPIEGFLDDYAFCIEAFIALYEATFDEWWIREAKRLSDYTIAHFYDSASRMFYYTSDTAEKLISRKHEIMDNVIPSSNSALVRQLHKLGLVFDDAGYQDIVSQALANVAAQIKSYGSAYSNWAIQLLEEVHGTNEIILTGPEVKQFRKQMKTWYVPNKLLAGGVTGTVPILKNRIGAETQAFLCKRKSCSLPVKSADELLKLIM